MKRIKIEVGEKRLTLKANLRAAYILQGYHNHKSYAEIFESVGDMTVEEQIGILYAAYKSENKEPELKKGEFEELLLDECDLSELRDYMSDVIEGIMGKKLVEEADAQEDNDDEGNSKVQS